MVLLDSSFLIAYHNERDIHHPAAALVMKDFMAGVWGPGVLLEYVFVEVVTVLLARRGIRTASSVASVLLQAREIEFIPCSDIFLQAFETFRAQSRSTLSFTDAAIVTVARQRDVPWVATFDSDFQGIDGVSVIPE